MRISVKKNHCRVKCGLYAELIQAVTVRSVRQRVRHYIRTAGKKEISFNCLKKYVIIKA
jgi:hypothetical protein